ncbi:MAG TPA: hypothetical protein VE713_18950, partial [Pyrinomonadaceae bacterium]|nr:hypothetical protein [Pyrinomonadaceae bacterium]
MLLKVLEVGERHIEAVEIIRAGLDDVESALLAAAIVLSCSAPAPAQRPTARAAGKPERTSLVERVGATGILQVEAESFRALSPRQKMLAYYLSQAAIAIDPIIYDQLSR